MRVFLTGATGFVGHYVLRALLDRGHTVRCLLRPGSGDKLDVESGESAEVDSSQETVARELEAPGSSGANVTAAAVELVYGDVTDLSTIQGDMRGCDAVIHLVGIIEENKPKGVTFERIHVRGTRTVVEEAKAAGIGRFIHMSANGAREDAPSDYQTTKWHAEQIVREAGFDAHVIFRPSIIFGDPGEGRVEFASRLADTLIDPFPVLPILGDGQYELQPVHVTAVADAFASSVEMDLPEPVGNGTNGEGERLDVYCVAGHERVTFDETVDRITRGMGKRPKPKLHQPMWLAKALVGTAGEVGLLPISPAQFKMLIEGNTCDSSRFWADFDVADIPFTPEHLSYLQHED
jgi:NADH dehydrogenase